MAGSRLDPQAHLPGQRIHDLAVATYVLLVRTSAGKWFDETVTSALGPTPPAHGYSGPVPWPLATPANWLLVAAIVAVAVIGALRRTPWRIVTALGLIIVATVAARLLKLELHRPALTSSTNVAANSFPSGHVTLATATVIALLMVLPRALRPLVAVAGAGWVTAVGVATLLAGWHRPSDVLGAVLLTAAVAGVAAAALRAGAPEPATHRFPAPVPYRDVDTVPVPAGRSGTRLR
ncbi:phosphatase PAP2 family protein [Pseudonocardia sp. GCM10023141]|uniref:phosphatase PAP2 family protein n=1 Tax=Pseudonocardia sp. GCM10023141 TaxID=3252653 RepID=UPI003612749D